MKRKRKARGGNTSHGHVKNTTKKSSPTLDLDRVESHRHALALMPEAGDRQPGVAFFVKGDKYQAHWRFCSCALSKTKPALIP